MNYFEKKSADEKKLLERFLRYAKTFSESNSENAEKGIMPSTLQQKEFATSLANELESLGLQKVCVTEFSYVYGILPASENCENAETFCLLSHLDTVDEVSGKNVVPIVHENYDGKKITLKDGVSLDVKNDCALANCAERRDTIITSSGTTLLGADDKAGIAEIVSAIEFLQTHKEISHGAIEIIFSPDEETGHGMDKVPKHLLQSKYAFTVDGGNLGELECECFNAVGTTVHFFGKATHTGSARNGGMLNAIEMVSKFISLLPHRELPETTDNREGFFAPMEITGSIERSSVYLLLRDFDETKLEERKAMVEKLAEATALSFHGSFFVEHKNQYRNMKKFIDEHKSIIDNLHEAYKRANVEARFTAIRGGTDGARLSEMGIPTPNIFTGGHNFHSKAEWASLFEMCKACDVLVNLAQIVAGF